MNKIKFFICAFFALLGAVCASGQTMNRLSVATVPSSIGNDIQVPVQMDNTDEIVAIQFDIVVPDEIRILNEAVATNRWDDHVAVVKNLGNGRSRVMVYSPSNSPLRGNSGNIILLKAHISESCVEGEEYPADVNDIVLTKGNGDNCVTASRNGKFVIVRSPDLVPESISVNKTSVSPADTIRCSWRVRNLGGLPTAGGWKEQVFAVSDDGRRQVLLGSQYNGNIIASQGEIVRSMEIAVPEVPGIDGRCLLMVKIVPDADCGEPVSMTGNNACQSDQSINIAKNLYLDGITQAVDERSQTPVRYKLTRSGSTLHDETFTIRVGTPDSRVAFPATVEIPRNQSSAFFYITLAANGRLDESDQIGFSIAGNEYPEISSVLSIMDDTFPKLDLTLSKDEVSEGESFDLTIRLPKSFSDDTRVFLSSDNSAKIKVPEDVVIPAGQTSLTVPLVVIDNEDAELETSVRIRVTADGLDGEEREILVLDDDMPALSLTFSPSEISENAGVSAVIATVRRLTNVDKNVRLLLFDDSKGAIELSHTTLSMGKGAESVQFLIDIKDNDIVDGDRKYNVTAAVYSTACDCYASELSGGQVSQVLTVLDDDGPHLSMTSATQAFLEGSAGNIITVSRNTDTGSDMTVSVSSDKDDLLDYDHSVVIPSGATSAELKVAVLGNDTSGDGDIVSFKAESDGMAPGSCWVVLTDQTLPDATIQLEVSRESPSAGESVDLILTISNIGNAPLQRNTPVDIECTGVKGAKRVYTKNAIGKGENDRLVVEDFRLPERTGAVTISAVINDNESVSELLYSNNSARPVELILTPAFEVTASVDKSIYTQEEDVVISGRASGEAGKNAGIEIHLSNNGVRQILNATTDDNGNYEYTHKLLSRQTGHFTVSACYPTSSPVEESAAFDVYGLQIDNAFVTCEPGLGETFNGTFRISNPGNLSQKSLDIKKVSVPANCEFTYEAPSRIDAGETVEIPFSLKGTGLSSGKDFEKIPLVITTAEGSQATFTVYYYIQSLHGKLYTSTPSITTTMLKDTPRDYPLVIRNIGKGETGKITFALPSWVETATPREMASLAAGDSTTVMLRFKPMDEMKLNVATKGKLGVNCENGDGLSVSFDIMPVSEAVGTLKVDVVDEFTFYTAEAPHVSNALVRITHPTSREVIAEGRTGSNGIFTTEIQEGWYTMSVEADSHDIYTENIIISPGTELSKEVFMPYQAITYSWTVEETEIDDEYVFETTVDFDTRVPKPVVVISLPDEKPEPYSVIPVKITNKGLINAVNIEMSLEVSEGFTLEFLSDPTAEVLAPQQTLVFYAKLVPAESASDIQAKAPGTSRECIWIISKAKYQELCKKYTGDQFVRMLKKYGRQSCFSSGVGGGSGVVGGGVGGSGGGVGRPGCWGGGSSYKSDYYVIDWSNPEKYCDRKPGDRPQDGDDDDEEVAAEGDPEENDDCEEEPDFRFNVTEVDSRAIRKGVAADGVSQLRISIDPSSRVPKEECGYNYWWELSEDFGELSESESYREVVYTAPENFNDYTAPDKQISVIFKYQKPGEEVQSVQIPVTVVRVPLVMVHGLGDSFECWEQYFHHLLNNNYYDVGQLKLVNYASTNTAAFSRNYNVVTDAISEVIERNRKRQIVATKVDLIGHSMGGILSRFHVQHGGGDNVHKLITVNTPHSGSEVGDIVVAHDVFLDFIAKKVQYKKDNIEAVYDLAVNSTAINEDLNSRSMASSAIDVPVHAISSNSIWYDLIVSGGSLALDGLGDRLQSSKNILMVTLGILSKYFSHVLSDDYSQLGHGDLIVSNESQQGGAKAVTHKKTGPWHCDSPRDASIWDDLDDLLNADVSSHKFSTDWFNPAQRRFVHNDLWAAEITTDLLISQVPNLFYKKCKIEKGNSGKKANSQSKDGREVNSSISISFSDDNVMSPVTFVNFGDQHLFSFEGYDVDCPVPATYQGPVQITTLFKDSDNKFYYAQDLLQINESRLKLEKISCEPIYIEISHTTEPFVSCEWSDGSSSFAVPDSISVDNDNVTFSNGVLTGLKKGKSLATIYLHDSVCNTEIYVYEQPVQEGDKSDAICSTVTLSFKQTAVMTRQAFRGIFSLNNGHQTATLRDFRLNLEVKDQDGVVATRREFEITPEKLAGFQGSLDFNSGWSLEPSHNGEASILFIPTKHAAPTEPQEYSFGGTFSYVDPYTGLTVTRTLNPVTLTVMPSPQLELTYFMQRDVFGDDPLTDEIEPMKPAEFALLLNNVGAGDATSLKLTTGQPKIVSNEKGLYINFEIISSQLNGGEQSLMLGGSAVTDFGSLKAGQQSYAQWWLQSSLLGHFVKYDVKSTHVTSHDNPELSLVDTVTIHELIHGFDLMADDVRRRAFLVNDIADVLDTPDQLYFTDGTQADVAMARDAYFTRQSDLEYTLNVSASVPGWNYGSVTDPTNGKQNLSSITRLNDGAELAIDNFWQTDRTLRDGQDPIAENLLHFIDNFSNGDASYRLTFTPKPDVELAVDTVIGLPDEDEILTRQLKAVTVRFNKPIDPSTFTDDDLSLSCQGQRLDITGVTITSKSDTEYLVDLSRATLDNGFYVLSIQTSSISDTEGFAGGTGRQVSWIQYADGKVKMTVSAMPADGGMVSPQTGLYDYEASVTLEATPSEGYGFLGWWSDDEQISGTVETVVTVDEEKNFTARFALRQFSISVDWNGDGGYVDGTASGIYDFGHTARLEAIPHYGWSFSHWTIDGADVADGASILELPVDHDTEIYATFVCHIKDLTIPLQQGWNWISSVFDDRNLHDPMQFFKAIKPVLAEVRAEDGGLVVNDGIFDGSIERIIPGAYKIKVNNSSSLRLKGAAVAEEDYEVNLALGWTWIPYVAAYEQNINDALANLDARENDILKSHTQFAVFSDGRWHGTLKSLVPDEGYMYYANEPTSFKYSLSAASGFLETFSDNDSWQYNERLFADNQTVIARIHDNGAEVSADDYTVGAFCGEECRGIGENVGGYVFITVHGKEGDNISFRAIDNDGGQERSVRESLTFDDNHLGTFNDPYSLNLGDPLGISEVLVGYGLNVSPSPVKDIMYVTGDVSIVKSVKVIAMSGLTLLSTDSFEHGVNVTAIPDGVYVAAIGTTHGVAYRKFVKKGY